MRSNHLANKDKNSVAFVPYHGHRMLWAYLVQEYSRSVTSKKSAKLEVKNLADQDRKVTA